MCVNSMSACARDGCTANCPPLIHLSDTSFAKRRSAAPGSAGGWGATLLFLPTIPKEMLMMLSSLVRLASCRTIVSTTKPVTAKMSWFRLPNPDMDLIATLLDYNLLSGANSW
eukprot:scpid84958/ scgid24346/ 